MIEDTDETLDDRLERLRRRAENFRELLKDGDEISVALCNGEMQVMEYYRSKFERNYPKLLGRMLSIDAMMNAGWSPYVAALLVAGVFIFGLQLSWWDGAFGKEVTDLLNTWWCCLIVTLVLLYFAHLACVWWGKLAYRRNRQTLHELIADQNLDRDKLLVMLRDEEEFDRVVHELKLDTGPFPPS